MIEAAVVWILLSPLSQSSFPCIKKLELESSGARSSENERLNGNNLSIFVDMYGKVFGFLKSI